MLRYSVQNSYFILINDLSLIKLGYIDYKALLKNHENTDFLKKHIVQLIKETRQLIKDLNETEENPTPLNFTRTFELSTITEYEKNKKEEINLFNSKLSTLVKIVKEDGNIDNSDVFLRKSRAILDAYGINFSDIEELKNFI